MQQKDYYQKSELGQEDNQVDQATECTGRYNIMHETLWTANTELPNTNDTWTESS